MLFVCVCQCLSVVVCVDVNDLSSLSLFVRDQLHKFLSVRHINQELGGKTTLAKARASKKPCKELDTLVAQVTITNNKQTQTTATQTHMSNHLHRVHMYIILGTWCISTQT